MNTVYVKGPNGENIAVDAGADGLLQVEYYKDVNGDEYFCYASAGTALSDSAWKVIRRIGNQVRFANSQSGFIHAATDLAAVKAYDYSIGA